MTTKQAGRSGGYPERPCPNPLTPPHERTTMTTDQTPLTDQQLDEYEAIANNATLLGADIASPGILSVLVAEVRRLRAVPAVSPVPPPADRAALPDRIAEARDRLRGMALSLATGEGPLVAPDDFRAALDEFEAAARAAVLPEPVDRAAVLRELIAKAEEWDGHITVQELRRMAAEEQPETPSMRLARASIESMVTTVTEERPAVGEQPAPVHAIPLPGSNGISSCCGRPPCEFVGERVTRDPDEVTCRGPE